MSLRDALQLAADQQLDLVEVAAAAKPPACRIMDFGKFRFEQQKRDKEAKKKQKVITLKEVKLRPNIEDHDYEVKKKNAQRFIADGDKVKVTIMFRGRELAHPELGRQILVRMANEMKEPALVEREPKIEGRNMFMILTPRPAKVVQPSAKPVAQNQTAAAPSGVAPQKKGGLSMPKMKTRRAAAKRFKITGTGEFKRSKSFHSHILESKSPKRKRNLRKAGLVSKSDHERVRKMLPYA